MGKYLKQGFVRELEWQHAREEISYSKMVDLMEEECIKNYLNRKIEVDPDKVIKTEPDIRKY
jgi:undecaprenyl pyrophosphate synthase